MLRVLHPFPSLLVAGLTTALVWVADHDAPLSRYLVMGIGMLCYQFAIGVVNDVVDLESDRVHKPHKPLAAGIVSPASARLAAIVLCLAGLLATLPLPVAAWFIGVAGLGCGLAYDIYLKRTPLSWLPLSIALPLVPIWVYVASDTWEPILWWTLPLGALIGLSLHLANQAPDVEAGEVVGLAGMLGAARSRLAALVLFGVVGVAVTWLAGTESATAGLVAAPVTLLGLVAAPLAPRLEARDGTFGVLAIASAALAVLLLAVV